MSDAFFESYYAMDSLFARVKAVMQIRSDIVQIVLIITFNKIYCHAALPEALRSITESHESHR